MRLLVQRRTSFAMINYSTTVSKTLGLLVCLSLFSFASPVFSADCGQIPDNLASDDPAFGEYLNDCWTEARLAGKATGHSIIGYMYRNGLGVHRNLDKARQHFSNSLDLKECEAYAYCGMKTLSDDGSLKQCSVTCNSEQFGQKIPENDVTPNDLTARERAHQILAEIILHDRSLTGEAEELEDMIDTIIDRERSERDAAFIELCTGHVRRGVVAISLAYHHSKVSERRAKLLKYFENKVAKGQNASAQAEVQRLGHLVNNSKVDKQVYFEKYSRAVFAANDCGSEMLTAAFKQFQHDIDNAEVTDLEQRAFKLFDRHVDDANKSKGINSRWFQELDDLLE